MYVLLEGPDSRGSHYPKALFQTFTDIYVGQISLLGMFIIGKAYGPIVLQAMGLGVAVFCHILLKAAFDRQLLSVPLDAMKPLDGFSTTNSFHGYSDSLQKVLTFQKTVTSKEYLKKEKAEHAEVRVNLDRHGRWSVT